MQVVRFINKMINTPDLIRIARERLGDAEALMSAHRYDAAAYICGYSVEIALKYKLCQTLDWSGFPWTSKELENYESLQASDLDLLLILTGSEARIKAHYFTEWLAFSEWTPEAMYSISGKIKPADAINMINAAKTLIDVL